MATPGDLIRTIADVTGIPEATVVVYDRSLLDAGLRTKGGRGRSAAKMTALDCARDLLAVMGGIPAHAAEFVAECGKMEPLHDPASESASSLLGLGFPHTLEDAISTLLNNFADGSIDKIIKDYVSPIGILKNINKHREKAISLTIQIPYISAYLSISFKDDVGIHEGDAITLIYAKDSKTFNPTACDLKTKRTISGKTFRILGELLNN